MTSTHKISTKIKSGFTLIELTITIAILGLTLTLTGGVLISVVKSFQKQSELQKIERNGDLALRTIEEKVRKAKNIEHLTSSPFSSTSQGIKIFGPDSTTGEIIGLGNTTSGCTDNNNVFLYDDIPPLANLNVSDKYKITNDGSTGVDITKLEFTIVSGNPIQVNATIEVSSSACGSPSVITKTFSTFVTARGSY